jgi:hypothetical protein
MPRWFNFQMEPLKIKNNYCLWASSYFNYAGFTYSLYLAASCLIYIKARDFRWNMI